MGLAGGTLSQIVNGQVPADVVILGGVGLFAVFLIAYSISMLRKNEPAVPQAKAILPEDPPAPRAKVKAVPPAPDADAPQETPSGSSRLEPQKAEAPKGDAPESGESAEVLAERDRIRQEFIRSAVEAAEARRAGRETSRISLGGASGSDRIRAPSERGPREAAERPTRPGGERGDKVSGSTSQAMRFNERAASTDRIEMRFDGRSGRSGPGDAAGFEAWKERERRITRELEEQNTELTNLLTMLPALIKRLTETAKKRELAPLLADTVMRLCLPPPESVMVWFLAKNRDELVLAARLGYDGGGDSAPVVKIPKFWGRVGYAVRHQLTMDTKDFERDGVDDAPPPGQSFRVEIASPLVFNKEVIGAISVEGFAAYNKNSKRFVGISAQLGALAISLAEKTAQIQHQANSDALTGLYNKRYFFERLEVEVERAKLSGKPLSIFMFDIDHFKKYNDRNGHPAGDEALKITGHLLNERKRETDVAARYGGEEFIVILPETPKDGAFIMGESFRKIVESYPYPHGEGQPLGRVSISGGVATWPEDGATGTALIETADACLYRSKEAGRNHVSKPQKPPSPTSVPAAPAPV